MYVESPSLPAAMAAPKYRPFSAADAPSVEAASAGPASATSVVSDQAGHGERAPLPSPASVAVGWSSVVRMVSRSLSGQRGSRGRR